MQKKYEILNTIEITDDIVCIIAKKKDEKSRKCGECNCCRNITGTEEHICIRYKAIVSPDDDCIEVGM